MTAEYKAINPSSTVPALVDGDVNVFDSTAIAIYLVDKYSKDNSVYPTDVTLRAKINEKLFYVGNYLFPRIFQIFVGGYFRGETEISQLKMDEMMRGYSTIESFFDGHKYLSSDNITLADLYLWATMESTAQIIPIDAEKFPNFTRWLNLIREHPAYELNKKGADDHIAFYRQCVEKSLASQK